MPIYGQFMLMLINKKCHQPQTHESVLLVIKINKGMPTLIDMPLTYSVAVVI
jgi:hypothetical protein